jgi:hypothetical protein
LETAAQNFPAQIDGAAILLEGDNQGANSALNHFRSPVLKINQMLQRVFQLCCERRIDVLVRWIPRENLTEADALSRLPDPPDWGLSILELDKVFQHFGCRPTADLFASDVHHVAKKLVSRFFTPGCSAVDATKQDWGSLAIPRYSLGVFTPQAG